MMIIVSFCSLLLFIGLLFYFRYSRSGKQSKGGVFSTNCSVCGKPSVKWNKQFCSFECEAQLAQNMPDWYKQIETD